MKKNFIACILIITALTTILCGCGADSNKNVTENTTVAEAEKSDNKLNINVKEVLSTELFGDENATSIDLNTQKSDVNITVPGVYALSGKLNGQIVVNTAVDGKVKLILNGAEIINDKGACIYIKNADKVIVYSNKDSINTLSSTGEIDDSADDRVDGTIYSHDDINLNGEGTINILSSYGHGVVSKDDLKVKGGSVNIISAKKGLSGKDAVNVEDGCISIISETNAMDSEGDIEVSGGELKLYSSRKNAMHADGNIVISDGNINISKCAEGIEGITVTISGGTLDITADDDGINSSGRSSDENSMKIGQNQYLTDDGADISITGGNIIINAAGDGIDANSTLNISGGEIYISGSETEEESAIDYEDDAIISGGKIVAVGSSATEKGFGDKSSQANILYAFNNVYSAGTELVLTNENGTEILAYSSPKSFSSVLLSSHEIVEGQTYYLTAGEDNYEITINSICVSNGVTQ